MRFGINLMLWSDDMTDELLPVLEFVREAGFDGVEVPLFDLDVAKWERWGRRLDEMGLERTANHVIGPEHDPVSPDPSVRKKAYEHMTQVVDCCQAAGVSVLAGPHQIALGVFSGSGPTEQEWQRSVEHIRRVADYAAPASVTLTEEVVNRFELYLLNILDEAIRFVDEVDRPNCRIHFDTFHANIEEKDPALALTKAGSRIGYVHISENDRGIPGTGHVPWASIFDALHVIGYDGWLTVEAFGNALPKLAASTRIWRRLFDSEEQVAVESLQFLRTMAAAHSLGATV